MASNGNAIANAPASVMTAVRSVNASEACATSVRKMAAKLRERRVLK